MSIIILFALFFPVFVENVGGELGVMVDSKKRKEMAVNQKRYTLDLSLCSIIYIDLCSIIIVSHPSIIKFAMLWPEAE
jgi:hypothetical protein